MASAFRVTLDGHRYARKPDSAEVRAITRRMQAAGPVELDAAAFCEAVRRGQTWAGGCFGPRRGGWGKFESLQVCALDFDNATEKTIHGQTVKDADGHKVKRPLHEGEAGFLHPLDALRRCQRLKLAPLCLYFTMSAQLDPPWYKYRLVFDLGHPITDEAEAAAVTSSLLAAFPEGDKACKNINRLFFGSCGEVWETWQDGRLYRGEQP